MGSRVILTFALILLTASFGLATAYPPVTGELFVPIHNLAVAYAQAGDYAMAEQTEIEALTKRNHANVKAKWVGHLLMASIHLERNDDQKAVEELRRTLILNPHCIQAYKSLADIYNRNGARENAAMMAKIVINLDPLDQSAYDFLKRTAKL